MDEWTGVEVRGVAVGGWIGRVLGYRLGRYCEVVGVECEANGDYTTLKRLN